MVEIDVVGQKRVGLKERVGEMSEGYESPLPLDLYSNAQPTPIYPALRL
jgi:hypothetical protein